ncbi:MAG: hypothetical protein LEGION0398_MBIBDBAK_01141 [Legionellaceae bacterium]
MLRTLEKFPINETKGFISSTEGYLETLIDFPKGEIQQGVTAIICHPHPLMGGTMMNKVVVTTAKALREIGVKTVCFNFRGVGESSGTYGQGLGEADDLRTMVNWVQRHCPNDILWLGGFSFGAYISIRMAKELPISLLLSLAPPVHYPEFEKLSSPTCPWVLVQGGQDDVVDANQVFAWAAEQSNQPTIIDMPEAGHFFHGRLIQLREELKNTLNPFLQGFTV